MELDWLRYSLEVIALLSAAIFFTYKLITGYFRLNLSIAATCHRQKLADTNMDVLVITIFLEKGTEGSLRLHDAQAKITTSGRAEFFDFPGIRRSAYAGNNDDSDDFESGGTARINWEEIHLRSPYICMTPNEKTELALHCNIASGEVCEVEVAIAGRKVFRSPKIVAKILGSPRMGQWKASTVVPPIVCIEDNAR